MLPYCLEVLRLLLLCAQPFPCRCPRPGAPQPAAPPPPRRSAPCDPSSVPVRSPSLLLPSSARTAVAAVLTSSSSRRLPHSSIRPCLLRYPILHAPNQPLPHSAATSAARLLCTSSFATASHSVTHPATSRCRFVMPVTIAFATLAFSPSSSSSPGLGSAPASTPLQLAHCLRSVASSAASPASAALASSSTSVTLSRPRCTSRAPALFPLPPPCRHASRMPI